MDASQQQLVVRYTPLAKKIAKSWAKRFPGEIDDIMGAALLGLSRSAAAYRGGPVDFSVYCRQGINGEIAGFVQWTLRRHDRLKRDWLVPSPDHQEDDRLDAAIATLTELQKDAVIGVVAYDRRPADVARDSGYLADSVNRGSRDGLIKLRKFFGVAS